MSLAIRVLRHVLMKGMAFITTQPTYEYCYYIPRAQARKLPIIISITFILPTWRYLIYIILFTDVLKQIGRYTIYNLHLSKARYISIK